MKRIVFLLKPGLLVVLSLVLTGCLTGGSFEAEGPADGGGSRGISLSAAMQSSASGNREPLRTGSYSSSEDTTANVAVAAGSEGGGAAPGLSTGDTDLTFQVPADVAYAVPFSGEFESITRFTLTPLCVENDRFCGGIFVSGDIMDLKLGSLPSRAIDNPLMFELGVSGRVYLNRARAFISPYLSANLSYQLLTWSYKQPVPLDNGGQVQSDALEGMGGYAGCGIAINRNKHLSFFGEAGFGGTVFVDQTVEGFSNDVFHNFGYFQVKAGLCYKF